MWSDEQTDTSGSLSADGHWLTFTDWNTGDLSVRDLAAGKSTHITRNSKSGEYAGKGIVSPDGARLAYTWLGDLHICGFDGRADHVIASGGYTVAGWTPDGRRLLVVRQPPSNGSGELGFADLDSGRFSFVAKSGPFPSAALSPDSASIALSELAPEDLTRRHIRLVDARSGESRVMFSGEADDYAPVWSRDGSGIVFLSDRGGRPGLWYARVQGRRSTEPPRRLADAPDGFLTILGILSDGSVYLGAEDIGGQQAYTATVDWTTGLVENHSVIQTPPFTGSRRAVFAPDNQRIAYLRKGRGYVVRPGWQTPVVNDRAYPTTLTLRDEPVWTADGKSLLFAVNPEGYLGEGGSGLWTFQRLDLAAGTWSVMGSAVAPGQVRIAGTASTTITYLLNNLSEHTGSIFRYDLSSKEHKQLYRLTGGGLSDAAVSPDGTKISFTYATAEGISRVQIVTLADGSTTDVSTLRPNARAQLMWFPDGASLLMSGRLGQQNGIWRVPVRAGEPQRLRLDVSDLTEARLSGDAKRIAYTRQPRLPAQVIAIPTDLNQK